MAAAGDFVEVDLQQSGWDSVVVLGAEIHWPERIAPVPLRKLSIICIDNRCFWTHVLLYLSLFGFKRWKSMQKSLYFCFSVDFAVAAGQAVADPLVQVFVLLSLRHRLHTAGADSFRDAFRARFQLCVEVLKVACIVIIGVLGAGEHLLSSNLIQYHLIVSWEDRIREILVYCFGWCSGWVLEEGGAAVVVMIHLPARPVLAATMLYSPVAF